MNNKSPARIAGVLPLNSGATGATTSLLVAPSFARAIVLISIRSSGMMKPGVSVAMIVVAG
jgi:hypothetical protein